MSKRIFILLIVLMITALVGIITVQVFWLKSSVEIREAQFENNVKEALTKTSEVIQNREIDNYYEEYSYLIDSVSNSSNAESSKTDFFFSKIDTIKNEVFTFKQTILEKTARGATSSLFSDESIDFTTYFGKKEKEISGYSRGLDGGVQTLTPVDRIKMVGKLSKLQKVKYESYFKEIAPSRPIYDRVSKKQLQLNLINELRARGIETKFEFGVLNEDFLTKLKSDNFNLKGTKNYLTPLFADDIGSSEYTLSVNFPDKEKYLFKKVINILIISAVFIIITILAFAGAIYQLLRQKKISEIKTDFINNMTHEFKTPIATINLALDAIKNPKIINDQDKVLRYTEMIRQENKRMNGQVENVLRISRLEKNQLDLSRDVVDLQEVVEEAITHVNLIVKNKGGYIKTHFNAKKVNISANKFHLTNVIVNVLDNAVKYTKDSPKIDIYTENKGDKVLLKVKDKGIGMSKNVQKQIFDKFYREQKGNIHNVKGHGLGLSYVKSIVEHHSGSVYVDSEKGKGSTFSIELPLNKTL